MRRTIRHPLVVLAVTAGSTLAIASPALAHGYVSSPPSRQALCASGAVPDCGAIRFEPQSVEGPKGLTSCDGGLERFAVLADESRNWPAENVGATVDFTWVMTARHRTANWEYFVDGVKVATVDGGNQQPDAVVRHAVDLDRFPGRHKVLAVWNIGDTANAFYSCIDLNIGGSSSSATNPPPASDLPSADDAPPATGVPPASGLPPADDAPPATNPPPAADSGSWAPGVSYKKGDIVTYRGVRYECRQAHTSIVTWEPSIYTLALWLPL